MHLHPCLTMMRSALISLYFSFVFTSLQELSQTSSIHLPECEVVLPDSSQALPQLPDPLAMTYPPEAPCGVEYHDTAESSGGIPMMKRWLQTVIRRGHENQGSHQPARLFRERIRPANPRSRSNSPARGNTTNKKPSRMAAARRRPVSVFFFW